MVSSSMFSFCKYRKNNSLINTSYKQSIVKNIIALYKKGYTVKYISENININKTFIISIISKSKYFKKTNKIVLYDSLYDHTNIPRNSKKNIMYKKIVKNIKLGKMPIIYEE